MTRYNVVNETLGDKVLRFTPWSVISWVGTTLATYKMFEREVSTNWFPVMDSFRWRFWFFELLFEYTGFAFNPLMIILYGIVTFWAESGVVKYGIRLSRMVPIIWKIEYSSVKMTLSEEEATAYVDAKDWLQNGFVLFVIQLVFTGIDFLSTFAELSANDPMFSTDWVLAIFFSFLFVFIGEVIFNVQQDPRGTSAYSQSGLDISARLRTKNIQAYTAKRDDNQ